MRMIDADELKEWMANWLKMDHYYHPYARKNIPVNELEDIIERMPTVDAVPVVHGKWLPIIEVNEYGEPYQSGVYCSECGETSIYEPNYCPSCGARMDEK